MEEKQMTHSVDLNQMTIEQLKAFGFDYMIKREELIQHVNEFNTINSNLNVIRQKIHEKEQAAQH